MRVVKDTFYQIFKTTLASSICWKVEGKDKAILIETHVQKGTIFHEENYTYICMYHFTDVIYLDRHRLSTFFSFLSWY